MALGFDYVQNLTQKELVVLGYSLGGASAVQVAAKRDNIGALLLVSTFSNLKDVVEHLEQTLGIFKFRMASKLKGYEFNGDEAYKLPSTYHGQLMPKDYFKETGAFWKKIFNFLNSSECLIN